MYDIDHHPIKDTKASLTILAILFAIIALIAWRLLAYADSTQLVTLLLPPGASAAFDGGAPIAPKRQETATGAQNLLTRLTQGEHRIRITLADGEVIEQTLVLGNRSTSAWTIRDGQLVQLQ